jgi:hypothetical protein
MGKIAATVAPALILVIAMFMILVQLRIAPQIVEIAFAATMGALALGLALAFGLGGRPVAQEMLQEAYRKGREEQVWRPASGEAGGQPGERRHSEAVWADTPQPATSEQATPPQK